MVGHSHTVGCVLVQGFNCLCWELKQSAYMIHVLLRSELCHQDDQPQYVFRISDKVNPRPPRGGKFYARGRAMINHLGQNNKCPMRT